MNLFPDPITWAVHAELLAIMKKFRLSPKTLMMYI